MGNIINQTGCIPLRAGGCGGRHEYAASANKAPLTPSQVKEYDAQLQPALQTPCVRPAPGLARPRARAGLATLRLALGRPAPARPARACACDRAARADCCSALTATVAARSTRHTMTEQAQGLRACGQCWADRLGVDYDSARQRLRATGGLASLKVKETHHSRAVVRHDVRAVGLVRKAAAFWTGAFPRPLPAHTQTPATCSPIQCISSTAFHKQTEACAVTPLPLSETVRGQSRRMPSQHTDPVPVSPWPILLSARAKSRSAVGQHGARGFVDAAIALPALLQERARSTFEARQPAGRAHIVTGCTWK